RDERHGANVAIKVLHPELAPHFAGERFAREIRITAGLQHPNVVPVLDSGTTDGLPFYTMPYVEGESLAALVHRQGQLPIADALRIATSVADALAYAHDRGFVHRDIKPQNILLSQGHAVLADFGIARAMDISGGERITESGVALGTAMYMSPEQGSGGRVDGRSDIYALGCVLYEMLAGAAPFTGSTPQTVLARHALDPVPPIRTVRQTVGPTLEQVLALSLAKVPADRYANALELKAGLIAAAAEQAALPATGRVRTEPSGRPRRSTIVGALAVVVAAVAGLYAWSVIASSGRSLDINRVAVFPLATRGVPGANTLGEDISTVIGHALDGTGTLRWIDGWRLLQAKGQTSTDIAASADLQAIARLKECAYYLTGRLLPASGDSVDLLLQLVDTKTGEPVKSVQEPGAKTDAWRLGIRAINRMLPVLIPGTTERELVAGWVDRRPEVVGAFLLGESSFRRARPAEALAHYRDALRGDSTFAIAAVRAAQAAVWEHRASEAAAYIRLAVAQPMPPRYAHFVRGYQFYIEGRAEAAAQELRQTLAIDPEMATAWMQLGETYTHLLHVAGRPSLVADSAFGEALRLDSSATHVLLHPIEMRLRRGQAAEAEPLIRRFLAADPDSTIADQIRLMYTCVSQNPAAVDWPNVVKTRPLAVLGAAQSLAVAGSQLPCAAAAYAAIRRYETPEMAAADQAVDARRWGALVGWQGVLIAEGRTNEAIAHIDSAITRGEGGNSLFIVGGTIVPAFEARAAESVKQYEAQWGPRCQRCSSNDRVWQLGVWATHVGDSASVTVLANELATRAKATGAAHIALMAQATAARAQLARGDSAAIAALTGVLATPIDRPSDLLWLDAEGRGPERLALVRALIRQRQFQRAIDVADVFDSPGTQTYVPYLPISLTLRADAADSLRNGQQFAYRQRLAALSKASPK
ncbi:MAG TPA: serine/threonine-protein kinase, partial [Gemmatimonadaceae bacterium]|nr:serine/threonine-protein kinase [Gemmatimonadaceae bacterium]